MSDLVIYGRKGPKCQCSGYDRFSEIMEKLSAAGIEIEYIEIDSGKDIPDDSEAKELFGFEGKRALPITVYMGAVVKSHKYPDEQDIVDYVDVPAGILDARRTTVAMSNELMPACGLPKRH